MSFEAHALRRLPSGAPESHSDPADSHHRRVTGSFSSATPPRSLPSPTSSPLMTRLQSRHVSVRLNVAFFLFGLLNNSLYVVILTAALELLPQGVPTGLVSFANIFPALIAKAVWPYLLKGTVRYTKRVWSCAIISFVGMLFVSYFPALALRLLGISLASFSSGLGELTFLQLSTRYAPKLHQLSSATNYAGDGVGWFASGTGAAGLVGAAAWWIVRPLGVQTGMAILSTLPAFMLLAYLAILPGVEDLLGSSASSSSNGRATNPRGAYQAVPSVELAENHDDENDNENDNDRYEERDFQSVDHQSRSIGGTVDALEHEEGLEEHERDEQGEIKIRLSFAQKMDLLKPMLLPYILPLVTVYFAEYTINQGVAPTLLYPLPTSSNHPLLSHVVKKLSDYYPLYQLVYQTFVFLSRSSISIFGLPAIPKRFLWVPALLQTGLLGLLTSESLYAWFRPSIASPLVIVLICVEGLAGGSAYVSVFYSIGTNDAGDKPPIVLVGSSCADEPGPVGDRQGAPHPASVAAATSTDGQLRRPSIHRPSLGKQTAEYQMALQAQEHEFRIGCVGVSSNASVPAMLLPFRLFILPCALSAAWCAGPRDYTAPLLDLHIADTSCCVLFFPPICVSLRRCVCLCSTFTVRRQPRHPGCIDHQHAVAGRALQPPGSDWTRTL
ncbi:CLN3-domain-containing protein [Testicularia cyperi]|uniref:CLN3-domain-containing protein n=1 Tax=Testicularia cyperi TaxID=1882483 RepID=A0A317XHP6_9BASI|nr:CLN3-domain-containing protein [Testicularia cyperi]